MGGGCVSGDEWEVMVIADITKYRWQKITACKVLATVHQEHGFKIKGFNHEDEDSKLGLAQIETIQLVRWHLFTRMSEPRSLEWSR